MLTHDTGSYMESMSKDSTTGTVRMEGKLVSLPEIPLLFAKVVWDSAGRWLQHVCVCAHVSWLKPFFWAVVSTPSRRLV